MRAVRLAIVSGIVALACASSSRSTLPRIAVNADRSCLLAPDASHLPQAEVAASDASLSSGPFTLQDPRTLTKTIVEVNDAYYDPRRIDPAAMIDAVVDAMVQHSDGALILDAGSLVAAGGARWRVPEPESIWTIPRFVSDLGGFLVRHLPPRHRLTKGAFAEILATNALLATLDRYSLLVPPGRLAISDGLHEAQPRSAARFRLRTLPDGLLHLTVGPFLRETPGLIREALDEASGRAAPGVILDLRGSPGGLLEATTRIIDLFMSAGTMLTLNGRDSSERWTARDDKLASERVKLAVLVDATTATGAEMVAGALRFGDRAILVGERTRGAGMLEAVYDYASPGAAWRGMLMLTVREALLPGDVPFEGAGIAPDVEVAAPPEPVASATGCAAVGQTVVRMRSATVDRERAVAVAARIMEMAHGPARADLIAAARSIEGR